MGKGLTNLFKQYNYQNIYSFGRELDVTNKELLYNKILEIKPDVIIHCAVEGGRRVKQDSKDVLLNNLIGFNNILSLAIKFPNLKLINFTSAAEYNTNTNINIIERLRFYSNPTDYYGYSKFLITNSIRDINKDNIFNLRLFNVFGPTEENDRFITTCIKKALKNENIEIFQDKLFSFFYIDDLFRVIEGVLKDEIYQTEINCVYNQELKLSNVAKLILNITNSKSQIKIKQKGLDYCGKSSITNTLDLLGLEYGLNRMIESLK